MRRIASASSGAIVVCRTLCASRTASVARMLSVMDIISIGEAAMRAVGHVIDNRRRSGAHGTYATETVSEAWQFSAWNRNDPNHSAMLNIDKLRPGSVDHQMWLTARRVAEEILAGASADPTGGALFYHTAAVSPRWSWAAFAYRRQPRPRWKPTNANSVDDLAPELVE